MRILLAVLLCLPAAASAEDFTADTYLNRVLDAAPEVGSSKQSYKAAEASLRQAIAEAWLPAFNASASATPWGNNPSNGNTWNPWRLNAVDTTYSFGATWNVFNSFYDTRAIVQKRLARDAALAVLDQTRQTRSLEALTTYLELFLKQKLKEVADVDLEAQKSQYDLTLDLYRHGMKSQSDLLKSETDWRSSELRAFGAESERRKALYHFNLLIGRGVDSSAELPELTQGPTRFMNVDEALGKAAVLRPELRRSAADLRSSELSVQGSAQNFLPKLSAAFSWNESRSATFGNTGLPSAPSRPFYAFGLNLSLPVGYTVATQAEAYIAARAAARQAAFERAALLRTVRENVYFTRIDLDQTLMSYEVGLQRERIAKSNLDIVLEQYRQGSADVIRLAQARADYLQAQTERLTLLHDTQLRWLQFRQATGEPLWER
ncbi:MAG: TolC family protein [Elusimicrobia bacterium]|nr:TolC family protein [Elusimicrobiota bacterium]